MGEEDPSGRKLLQIPWPFYYTHLFEVMPGKRVAWR
jgi:hypothetical protein